MTAKPWRGAVVRFRDAGKVSEGKVVLARCAGVLVDCCDGRRVRLRRTEITKIVTERPGPKTRRRRGLWWRKLLRDAE